MSNVSKVVVLGITSTRAARTRPGILLLMLTTDPTWKLSEIIELTYDHALIALGNQEFLSFLSAGREEFVL